MCFSAKKPPAMPVVNMSFALALSKKTSNAMLEVGLPTTSNRAKEVVRWTKISYHTQLGNVNII